MTIEKNGAVGSALWWVLAGCWVIRLVGMTTGTTALWGIDAAAYLPAWFAWTTWALLGAALIQPIGAMLTRGLERIGRPYETPSMGALVGLFAIVATGLLYLPDRLGFTGDFLLRISTAKVSGSPTAIFPQALPLDLWLHYTVPHEVARLRIAPVEVTSRVLDALEAGCLALLAVTLVRRAGLYGAPLASAGLTILVGAPLAIFTGLNKAFTELVVLAAALVAATMPGRSSFGRCVTTLAIFSVALALHRAALVLTPIVVSQLVSWFRNPTGRESRLKQLIVPAMALVALVLAWRSLVPVRRTDLPRAMVWPFHHASSYSLPIRALDLGNLIAFLVPSLALVPALLLDSRVREDLRSIGWWCACLAIPSTLLIGIVDAPQGYVRDWDMFAIAGLSLSVVSALAISRFLARTPGRSWLAASVVLSTVVPCVQLLVLQADAHAGLRRVTAFVEGPPRRSATLRASVLAFLGKRAWDGGDLASAASYGRRAAELAPSRSMLTLWGDAEALQGHYAVAESVYIRLVATSPDYGRGWLGLARVRLRSGRPVEAAAAAESALAIEPGSISGAELLRAARARNRQ